MRREHLYLQDILEACTMIQTFLEGLDASTFLANELHAEAICSKALKVCIGMARLN